MRWRELTLHTLHSLWRSLRFIDCKSGGLSCCISQGRTVPSLVGTTGIITINKRVTRDNLNSLSRLTGPIPLPPLTNVVSRAGWGAQFGVLLLDHHWRKCIWCYRILGWYVYLCLSTGILPLTGGTSRPPRYDLVSHSMMIKLKGNPFPGGSKIILKYAGKDATWVHCH